MLEVGLGGSGQSWSSSGVKIRVRMIAYIIYRPIPGKEFSV